MGAAVFYNRTAMRTVLLLAAAMLGVAMRAACSVTVLGRPLPSPAPDMIRDGDFGVLVVAYGGNA